MMNEEFLDLLQKIQQSINELKQSHAELSHQATSVDQRLCQVERCLVNLHNDARQSRGRSIWTDDERMAFSNWLATNAVVDEGIPKLPE